MAAVFTNSCIVMFCLAMVFFRVTLSDIAVGRDRNWYRAPEPDPLVTFSQQEGSNDVITSEQTWIVKFRHRADAESADICSNASNPCICKEGTAGSTFGMVMVSCFGKEPDELVQFLETLPYEIIRVVENKRYFGGSNALFNSTLTFDATSASCQSSTVFTSFPQLNPTNWGLDRCDQDNPLLDNSYNVAEGLTGCGVHIYIMDSGLYAEHEEFQDRVLSGWNVIKRSSNPHDDNGHGTHCMGIAAGRKSGVAKDAFVHAVKALDASGTGTSTRIFSGLEWIYEDITNNARFPAVLSLSIAAPGDDQNMNDIMKEFYDAGVFVVVASGNYNKDACAFTPANSNHVFTVGATDIDEEHEDVRTSFSNFGACVDVWAPGKDIISAGIAETNSYVTKSGTSMAAPFISGIAALYLQNHPTAGPGSLQDILKAGFTKSPTIITKEKTDSLLVSQPLMCSINTLETCTDKRDCEVSVQDDWSQCPESKSVCGQHLQRRHLAISQEPSCGGMRCPELIEYRDCADNSFLYEPCGNSVPAQWFSAGDNSLSRRVWNLSPVADDAYTSCFGVESSTPPEQHPSQSATALTVPDDSSVEYTLPGTFKFFGRDFSTVHIGSNGYLTFGTGDFRYASIPDDKPLEDLLPSFFAEPDPYAEAPDPAVMIDYSANTFEAETRKLLEFQNEGLEKDFTIQDNLASTDTHWDKKRISIWFQDLDPSSGDAKISVQSIEQDDSRVIIDFENIPCYGDDGSSLDSTFQVTLWLESSSNKAGNIQIWWGDLQNCKGAIVGLSPGYKPTEWKSSILQEDVSSCNEEGYPHKPPSPPSGSPEEPFFGQGSSNGGFSLFS